MHWIISAEPSLKTSSHGQVQSISSPRTCLLPHQRMCRAWRATFSTAHPSLPRLPDRAFTHTHSLLFNLLLIPGKNSVIWAAPCTGIIFQLAPGWGLAPSSGSSCSAARHCHCNEELIYEYEAPLAPGEQLQPPETPEHSACFQKLNYTLQVL